MPDVTQKFNTHVSPTWCPGCGNFGIFPAIKQALIKVGLSPHQVAIVTDIGCSGNMADFIKGYVFHSLHGRALPAAAGIKLANHKLPVIVAIGDGGCYGEGLNHFINLMRGNHDITILVHDNYIYGLTTGQYSPTTIRGSITKTTPEGSIEEALNPLALAIANHTTFAARGYSFEIEHLTNLIVQAINHKGFSLVDILQPCVTFNKNQKVEWYKEHIYKLESGFTSKAQAFEESQKTDKLGIGVFWQEKKPAYHEEVNTLKKETLVKKSIEKINIKELVEEFI